MQLWTWELPRSCDRDAGGQTTGNLCGIMASTRAEELSVEPVWQQLNDTLELQPSRRLPARWGSHAISRDLTCAEAAARAALVDDFLGDFM